MSDKRRSGTTHSSHRGRNRSSSSRTSSSENIQTTSFDRTQSASSANAPTDSASGTQTTPADSTKTASTKSAKTTSPKGAKTASGKKSHSKKKHGIRRFRATAFLMWSIVLLAVVIGILLMTRFVGFLGNRISQIGAGSGTSGAVSGQLQTTPAATETETAETIEPETAKQAEDTDKRRAFSMIFGGDVWLGNVSDIYESDSILGIISKDLVTELRSADLAVVNEDFVFGASNSTSSTAQTNPQRVKPGLVSVFQDMGIDLVSLANDHALDYGEGLLRHTFTTLDEAGIDYAGAGKTVERAHQWMTYQFGTTTVAVLCATRVLPVADWNVDLQQPGVFSAYDSTELAAQISAAKDQNDLVVVYAHWGAEKSSTVEDSQTELARACIDAGADLVVGCHPHVLQGIEYYRSTPIVYSLGNLIYDSQTDQSMLLKVDVSKSKKLTLQLIPTATVDSKTDKVTGDDGKAILNYVKSLSTNVKISSDGTVSQK